MVVHRLNHAVLYVRDAEASAAFYIEHLGFRRIVEYAFPGGVFLRAAGSTNDHDLALFTIGAGAAPSPAGRGVVGMYHLSWEVDTLADLQDFAARLAAVGSLVGATDHGTTRALYCHDPDGLEFELTWIVPAALLGPDDGPAMRPLDLDADVARFGAHTIGGIGISRPVPPSVP